MEADLRRLNEIDASLARLNKQTKELRKKKKDAENKLYNSMKRANVEKCGKYSIKKLEPKPSTKRKPVKLKKMDGMSFFQDIGAEDPETAYAEFMKTQKHMNDLHDVDENI